MGTDDRPRSVTSGFVTSDELRIHFEVHGAGPPLVLVHGWSASISFNWQLTGWLDALAALRQVIAIDLRGHGSSDKPHDGSAYGYRAIAGDVTAVLDHLDVGPADYVGYSLGAFTGIHLLGREPERFTSMVAIGIGDENEASLALAPRIADALRAESADRIADTEAAAYRMLVDLDPRNDREALALAALEMWPQGYPLAVGGPGLGNGDVPVLIVNGSEDHYAATHDALAAAIPGARVVEIPGADHVGVIFDPATRQAVEEFLEHH